MPETYQISTIFEDWMVKPAVTVGLTNYCSTNLFRQHTSSSVEGEIARVSASVDLSRGEQNNGRARAAIKFSRVEVELFKGTDILVIVINVLSECRISRVGGGHNSYHGRVLVLAGHVGRAPFAHGDFVVFPWLMMILVVCLHNRHTTK